MIGAIIVNGFYKPNSLKYQLERLTKSFKDRNTDIEIYDTLNFKIYIEDGKIKTDLKYYDFIVYLDKDKHIARLLEKAGYKLFNKPESIELCDDKMLTYITLSENGLKIPKTFNSPLMYNSDADFTDNSVERIESLFDYPLIIKELHGSLGKQVYLINNREELKETREKLKTTPHLYQQYISSSFGRDARIIVIGGKAASCILRKNDKDFRSNVELGASAYKFTPSEDFIKTAEQAAKILNLDYCGVDLLFDKDGKPVLCEVNSNAYFTASEKISGIDIAGRYAEHIINKLRVT